MWIWGLGLKYFIMLDPLRFLEEEWDDVLHVWGSLGVDVDIRWCHWMMLFSERNAALI